MTGTRSNPSTVQTSNISGPNKNRNKDDLLSEGNESNPELSLLSQHSNSEPETLEDLISPVKSGKKSVSKLPLSTNPKPSKNSKKSVASGKPKNKVAESERKKFEKEKADLEKFKASTRVQRKKIISQRISHF